MKAVIFSKGESIDSGNFTEYYNIFEGSVGAQLFYEYLLMRPDTLAAAIVNIETATEPHWEE
jgi:hypothetical protein